MTEKLPTINLKGKEYVQVKDRVLHFNEENKNGSIITELVKKEDGSYAWFKATVTPDVSNLDRKFIAHSAGPVDEEKSFEKLETVAVGRALALMGIGIMESVASADEVDTYQKRQVSTPKKPTQDVQLKDGSILRKGITNGKTWWGVKSKSGMRFLDTEAEYEKLLQQ